MLALAIGLTGIAVALGVGLVTALQPGRGMDLSALPAADKVQPAGGDPVALIVDMVPGNVFAAASKGDLVAVLVFGVLFALALRPLEGPGPDTLRAGIDGLYRVCVRAVHGVLRAAPLGVAALMAAMVARTGLEGLVPLLRFVGVVLLGLGIQFIVVYGLTLRVLARRSPLDFARAVRPALAMAFSTASSAATLPTTLEVAERGLGLPPEQSRFVLTVGATANQNGTALFEGVAAIFLAQLYGVDLSTAQMATVCGIAILGGIGTAGVPGGALPVIAALLASLGVPVEAVGVIVGVDRLLDMCRTTLNVAGDLVIAEIVARRA
jgi:DAACS family dicarboxylate/amino acid:cation (Na+ or H+) symporter